MVVRSVAQPPPVHFGCVINIDTTRVCAVMPRPSMHGLVGDGECIRVRDCNLLLQGNQEVAQLGLEHLHALEGYGLWPQSTCRLERERQLVVSLDVRPQVHQGKIVPPTALYLNVDVEFVWDPLVVIVRLVCGSEGNMGSLWWTAPVCEGLQLHLFRCAHPVLQTHSSAYSGVSVRQM